MQAQQSRIVIGDIVRLNSGSPDLHVIGINDDHLIVEWDAGERAKETSAFPRDCVYRISEQR